MGRANQAKDCSHPIEPAKQSSELVNEWVMQVPLLDVTRAPVVVAGGEKGFGKYLCPNSDDQAPMKETPPREGKSTQKERGARTVS